jgi:hypothetical protein
VAPLNADGDAELAVAKNYFSVTIISVGNFSDVNVNHLESLAGALSELAGPDALWAAAVERGPVEGKLHFQCLAAATFANAGQLTRRLKVWATEQRASYQVRRAAPRAARCAAPPHRAAAPPRAAPRRVPPATRHGPRCAGRAA